MRIRKIIQRRINISAVQCRFSLLDKIVYSRNLCLKFCIFSCKLIFLRFSGSLVFFTLFLRGLRNRFLFFLLGFQLFLTFLFKSRVFLLPAHKFSHFFLLTCVFRICTRKFRFHRIKGRLQTICVNIDIHILVRTASARILTFCRNYFFHQILNFLIIRVFQEKFLQRVQSPVIFAVVIIKRRKRNLLVLRTK